MAKRWIDIHNPEKFLVMRSNGQQLARMAREHKVHNPERRPYGLQLYALQKTYLQHEKKLKQLEKRLWEKGKDLSPEELVLLANSIQKQKDAMDRIRARGEQIIARLKLQGKA